MLQCFGTSPPNPHQGMDYRIWAPLMETEGYAVLHPPGPSLMQLTLAQAHN